MELSSHIHDLRLKRTQRRVGYRMTAMEVWQAALDCPNNSIERIFLQVTSLHSAFDGFFARLQKGGLTSDQKTDYGYVYIDEDCENHWKEFIVIKELMHCWSSPNTFIRSPKAAEALISAMTGKARKYTAAVAADVGAALAAAEVMLPHYIVEGHLQNNRDCNEVASRHGLHPDVADMLCNRALLALRKEGSL